jgi:hypothetical protein
MIYSVALSDNLNKQLLGHLLRDDGQEDLCFVLWHPSQGSERQTALLQKIILPKHGDRQVHGNASFLPAYFERVIHLALENNS